MPLSATYQDIKAYQDQVEKNQITPHGLPPCPRCQLDSFFFKLHAFRERRFLIIVEMLVKAVCCTLVRFRCPDCGKTVTHYPDFAIPYKHYTRKSIEGFACTYVQNDQMTYQKAVATDGGVPERPVSGRALAPSSVHRWISTLADLVRLYCDAMQKSLSENNTVPSFENPGSINLPAKKHKRRERLFLCRWFFKTGSFSGKPVFTEFGIVSG